MTNNEKMVIVKPGIRSTEFWGKTILQMVLVLNALFGLGIEMDSATALQIAVGLEAVYGLARSIAKRPGVRGDERGPGPIASGGAALVLCCLLLSACAGTKARENVLMPAMHEAYVRVIERHVERGGGDPGESASLREALAAGDVVGVLALDWNALRIAALRGIEARLAGGEIGPGVAASIAETLAEFDRRMAQLGGE